MLRMLDGELTQRALTAAGRLDESAFDISDDAPSNGSIKVQGDQLRWLDFGEVKVRGERDGPDVVTGHSPLLATGPSSNVTHDEVSALTVHELMGPPKRLGRLGEDFGDSVVARRTPTEPTSDSVQFRS